MYISELAIHGFKSFAKKVRLQFGDGITVVVGPNGCGKTNIVDAVRWVLGEQKYRLLRGSKIEDIIFSGSEAKKPLNVCEVSLMVHNDKGRLPIEYTDVEITRRAFRNGESEYMINRTPCRLKDIQNLFIDTGMGADAYSVIELKMVEDILSESGENRRKLFEEAAGINRFKHQRRATFLKIEATKADLNRVSDIISEVENKVNSLRLQLRRFDRHSTLIKKLQNREIELGYLRKQTLTESLNPLRTKILEINDNLSKYGEKEKREETVLEQLQRTNREQEGELNIIHERIDELSRKREEDNTKILVNNEQAKSTIRTSERLQIEKEECSKKIQSFDFSIKELTIAHESLNPKISGKRSEYEERRGINEITESKFQELENKLEHLSLRQFENAKDLNAVRSLQERTHQMLDEKQSLLDQLESRVKELESDQRKLERDQKDLGVDREKFEKTISDDKKRLAALDIEIDKFRGQKHDLTLEFHRIANQVENLESQLQFYKEIIETKEGYPAGVRHILNNSNEYPGLLGTVAELIDVDSKYSSAVSAALGSLAYYIVCKTRDEALKIVNVLSRDKKGRASIIPLDSIKMKEVEKPELPDIEGILGHAIDLIKVEKNSRSLINHLLQGTIFVEDPSVAEGIWNRGGFSGSIADLSGRYYDQSGIITNISGKEEVTLLGRKEKIDRLDKTINLLVKKGNTTQEKTKKLDKELAECEVRHHLFSTGLGEHIDALADIEKQMTQNEFSIFQKVDSLQTTTHQIVSLGENILNLEKSLDQFIPKIKKLEEQQEIFQDKISNLKVQLEDVKKQKDKENNFIQDIRFELINLENERENLTYKIQAVSDNIGDLKRRKVELAEEIERLKSQFRQLTSEISITEKSLQKVIAQQRKLSSIKNLKVESFQEIRNQIDELQGEMRNQQKEREKVTEELKKIGLQVADKEVQIELIENRIHEKYQSEIQDILNITLSEDDLSMEIEKIERSIERIGPINMAVKGEFEHENSRLEFLIRQRTDLVESEKSLLESMDRVDSAARKQFLETYKQIRKNYQETFRLFFDGGEADLDLVGGDGDPLEADISILAKPPGKRTRSLRALSSGEKALTAISLLFAIYQVKPSPFCILDEVDAPLDDANIGRFARILKKFSEETQFIIVTHNKLTMEVATQLYGVTMEQSGISKIVSVKFD